MATGLLEYKMTDERGRELKLLAHMYCELFPTFVLYINGERVYTSPTLPPMGAVLLTSAVTLDIVLDWCRDLTLACLRDYESMVDREQPSTEARAKSEYYVHLKDKTGYLFMLMPGRKEYTRWSIEYVSLEPDSKVRKCIEEVEETALPREIREQLKDVTGRVAGLYRLIE